VINFAQPDFFPEDIGSFFYICKILIWMQFSIVNEGEAGDLIINACTGIVGNCWPSHMKYE
jgi:hypothetical protein